MRRSRFSDTSIIGSRNRRSAARHCRPTPDARRPRMRAAAIAVAAASLPALAPAAQFALPEGFAGTWNGAPSHTVLGPYSTPAYTLGISTNSGPLNDTIIDNNMDFDDVYYGWQRFYIEGSGENSGDLWYVRAHPPHHHTPPYTTTTTHHHTPPTPPRHHQNLRYCGMLLNWFVGSYLGTGSSYRPNRFFAAEGSETFQVT